MYSLNTCTSIFLYSPFLGTLPLCFLMKSDGMIYWNCFQFFPFNEEKTYFWVSEWGKNTNKQLETTPYNSFGTDRQGWKSIVPSSAHVMTQCRRWYGIVCALFACVHPENIYKRNIYSQRDRLYSGKSMSSFAIDMFMRMLWAQKHRYLRGRKRAAMRENAPYSINKIESDRLF